MKQKATDEVVMAFIAKVYPEAQELAVAAFDEMTCLKDATELITRLEAQVKELKELVYLALGELQWCSGSDDFQEGGKARIGWLAGPEYLMKRLVKALAE